MTVREVIKELSKYPGDWNVWMECTSPAGEGIVRTVVQESGGASTWVLLLDRGPKE